MGLLKPDFIAEQGYNFSVRPKTFLNKKINCSGEKRLFGKAVEICPQPGFFDHVEESGTYVSAITNYGTNGKNAFYCRHHLTFPQIRLKPCLTTSSLCANFSKEPTLFVDGYFVAGESTEKIILRGIPEIYTKFKDGLKVKRSFYPANDFAALIEQVVVTNLIKDKVTVKLVNKIRSRTTSKHRCLEGRYEIFTDICDEYGAFERGKVNELKKTLVCNASLTYYVIYGANKIGAECKYDLLKEIKTRERFLYDNLNLTTLKSENSYINTLYSFAEIRGCESIFETEAGLLHSPGGGKYYASVWANDQMEYAAPIFPILGCEKGIEATKNTIRLYREYADFGDTPFIEKKPLPSSIVGGGRKPFGIAGDRGDCAMVGLGAAQFALNFGDKNYAEDILPFIYWCVDFCLSRKTSEGVIYSDSDELEGRFPSGNCNLSTNINTLLLLRNVLILDKEIGNGARSGFLAKEIVDLENAIKKYFEKNVEGYDTYAYYENNNVLRSWICLPLTAGFTERTEGTIEALLEKLYCNGKMLTASNKNVVWDRSLLFALRGMFLAGKGEKALEILSDYSEKRLLGEHSPYPFEAFPEGKGAHLSGESLLYVRVIVEGLFGISTIGFGKLKIEPNVHKGVWKLSRLTYGDTVFDVEINGENITVTCGKEIYSSKKVIIFEINR